MVPPFNFATTFETLTGRPPFPWQSRTFDRLQSGSPPSRCDIPTGLGKTSVIPIWLIALANGAPVPRRLVYVVNRRTVVDQTTKEAERVRENGRKIGIDNLAISTLRGQFADNREWSADPSRPAVICGTVDMIGSRLLFGGYRIGFKSRPLHAGFLGQDALLVHDEAHLEPAFQKLIEHIVQEQLVERNRGAIPPWAGLQVMALSATGRESKETDEDALTLDEEDRRHPVVRMRIEAKKVIRFRECPDEKNRLVNEFVRDALKNEESGTAILVFFRSVENALRAAAELEKACPGRVASLTGTMRGLERDALVHDPVFIRFLPKSDRPEDVIPREGSVFLVCTSAGEVGVNLSADHMISDLSTLESMIQRLGRVNRFGEGDAIIDVVYPAKFDGKDPLSSARENALTLLQQLPQRPPSSHDPGIVRYDASPKSLGELLRRTDLPCEIADAFSPLPKMLEANDILFDAWALTTIKGKMPGRPPVAPYLHGIAEWEPAQTQVAWRDEVGVVTGDMLSRYPPEELLEDFPMKPHELLRDRSDRVFETLQSLAAKHPTELVWLVEEDGVTPLPLAELADPTATRSQARNLQIARISDRLVLISPTFGGLSLRGMLDGTSEYASDVAYMGRPESERRIRIWSDNERYGELTAGMQIVRSIEFDLGSDEGDEQPTWDWYKFHPLEDVRTAQKPVRWEIHVDDVLRQVDVILARLSLPVDFAQAIRLAARLHDHGKRRYQFQVTLGNGNYPEVMLAKSGRAAARLRDPYRHEFGSLCDAVADTEFQQLIPEMQDVVLHLIAAHHGRARPHFPIDEVFDPEKPASDTDEVASEVPRCFARLQRRFGRWGLAYLESILRAADWAASANPSEFLTRATSVSR